MPLVEDGSIRSLPCEFQLTHANATVLALLWFCDPIVVVWTPSSFCSRFCWNWRHLHCFAVKSCVVALRHFQRRQDMTMCLPLARVAWTRRFAAMSEERKISFGFGGSTRRWTNLISLSLGRQTNPICPLKSFKFVQISCYCRSYRTSCHQTFSNTIDLLTQCVGSQLLGALPRADRRPALFGGLGWPWHPQKIQNKIRNPLKPKSSMNVINVKMYSIYCYIIYYWHFFDDFCITHFSFSSNRFEPWQGR